MDQVIGDLTCRHLLSTWGHFVYSGPSHGGLHCYCTARATPPTMEGLLSLCSTESRATSAPTRHEQHRRQGYLQIRPPTAKIRLLWPRICRQTPARMPPLPWFLWSFSQTRGRVYEEETPRRHCPRTRQHGATLMQRRGMEETRRGGGGTRLGLRPCRP